MTNQHRKTKRCACGRGHAYTDNRPGTHRDEKGNFICSFCVFDNVLSTARAKVMAESEGNGDAK